MPQAEALEKTMYLIDYDHNRVGIIRWHPQEGLSAKGHNPVDQPALDEWLAGLLRSPIGLRYCEPEHDESRRACSVMTSDTV